MSIHRYIAFLRGINVAGQKKIKMEELSGVFEVFGLDNVVTYIQSGNVAFDTDVADASVIRKDIEGFLKESYNYEIPTLVRSQEEIRRIINANPFADVVNDSELKLYVYFLSAAPDAKLSDSLNTVLKEGERISMKGSELYFISPAYGETKLTNTFIERKLGVTGTARNWATVNKVSEL